VFFGDKNHFVCEGEKRFKLDEIVRHCEEKGIAFFDTSTAVRRLKDNASDKFLEVVTPTDIAALVAPLHHLQAIAVTGELAAQTLCNTLHIDTAPAVGSFVEYNLPATDNNERRNPIRIYRLPSSSRAYPLPIEKKAAVYQKMFTDLNIYSR
jgi:G:T/U-mismatch repair DNA glycosylase